MADHLRRRRFAHTDHARERHHLPAVGPGVVLAKRFRIGPVGLVGLHVDAVRAVVEVEVVHVGRAQVGLHRVGDLADRQTQASRLLAIDVNGQLRIVRGERAEEARDPLRLPRRADNPERRARQVLDIRASALIKHLECEAAELAKALNGWRRERNHEPVLNPEKLPAEPRKNRLEAMLLARPVGEVLQLCEDQPLVRRAPREAESGHREHRFDFRRLRQDVFRLLRHARRVPQRRAGRCLDDGHQVAGVLLREERLRQPLIDEIGGAEQSDEDDDHRPAEPHQAAHGAHVDVGTAVNHTLDRAEEGALSQVVVRQQQR